MPGTPKARPACPRCGGLEFMLAMVPGGGQAHICDACHWPRPEGGQYALKSILSPGNALHLARGFDRSKGDV